MSTISRYATPWKRGELIRHIISGKPALVVHIYTLGDNNSITLALDLEGREEVQYPFFIRHADYDRWVKDKDINMKEEGYNLKFTYEPLDI